MAQEQNADVLVEDADQQEMDQPKSSFSQVPSREHDLLLVPSEMVRREPVFLKHIAVEGFKSFRTKAMIGPLTNFSCIVGPNGAGKSVIGEALAFVLGGSAKTIRAKCLSALINEEMRQSTKLFAKVSVTIDVPGGHQVKLTRVISESSTSYIWTSDGTKRQLPFSEVKQELSKFGIESDIAERFIIMQSRQAIKAKQPLELCEYLEVIFGAGHYKGTIMEMENEICKMSSENITLQEKLVDVQSKIEKLQPDVDKWQNFDSRWHDFQLRKLSYLHLQEKTLRCKLQQNSIERNKKFIAFCKVKEEKDAIQKDLKNMNLEISSLKILLDEKKRDISIFEKNFLDLRSQMVKAQVRLNVAKREAEIKKQEHLDMDQQQVTLNKKMTSLSKRLDEIEDRKKALCQQKDAVKHAEPLCCVDLASEDKEVPLLEKLTEYQRGLVNIQREIEGHQRNASKLSAQILSMEKQCNEMSEAKKKQRLEASAVEEALHCTISESDKLCSDVLPDLKEALRQNELELFSLKKVLQHVEKRVSRNSMEDKAVELLMVKFKGKFHGRLIDLGKIKGSMIQAVNSVMIHLMNLSKTFVTEDRKTAHGVISYFQDHKIGVVTCEILSELADLYQNAFTVPEHDRGLRVLEYIQCPEIYRPVFWNYTRNWIILEDRHAAISWIRRNSKALQTNIVTLNGEIFKQDGEVISAIKNLPEKYLLRGCNDRGVGEGSESLSPTRVRMHEARLNFLLQQQILLKQEVLSNENKLAALEMRTRDLQTQNLQQGTQVDSFILLDSRLAEKKKTLSNLCDRIEGSKVEVSRLQKLILQLEELRDKSLSSEVADWKQKVNYLDEAIKCCDLEAQQTKSNIKSLPTKLKAVETLAKEVAHTGSMLVEAEQQYLQAKEELDKEALKKDRMTSYVDDISQRLVDAGLSADKLKKRINGLQQKEVELQAQLRKISDLESDIKDRIDKVLKALPEYCVETPPKRRLQDLSDVIGIEHLERDDEDDEGIALAEEEVSLKELHRAINPGSLEEDLCLRKEEIQLGEKMETLEKVLHAVKLQKEALENERFNIFTKSVREVNNNLSTIYGGFTKHGDAYLSFTEEKTLLFTEGVNFQGTIDHFFVTKRLNTDGSVSWLIVRPGRHKWCAFSSLSGGQQALAALALSFSIQLQFPSPFYFFDEIDAALDTKNTQLVANYVKKQTSTQYIIVSHRPQLYEHASTIAGVYHCRGSSRSITAQVR